MTFIKPSRRRNIMPKTDNHAKVVHVDRSQIAIDAAMQSRAAMNEGAIEEYRAAMLDGQVFPPCLLVDTGSQLLLCDGFHRLHAYERAGIKTVPCIIKDGTREQAQWQAAAQNVTHGVRRTNEDKRRAVLMAVQVKPDASLRDIASHCGVTHEMVRQIKLGMASQEIEAIPDAAERLLAEVNEDPMAVAAAAHAKATVAVTKAVDTLQRIMASRHGAHIDGEALQEALARVMAVLEQAAPAAICEVCHGTGCEECKGAGWVPG
jgi:ParB-like chromosome segregation protein Spo0J